MFPRPMLRAPAGRALLVLASALGTIGVAPACRASFHFMQIEMVIGGVNGDTSAQAIQLRMRTFGQNLVNFTRMFVVDAQGLNPVMILDMTTDVANSAAGANILICSSSFTGMTTPPAVPDFTMTNTIPASYMAGGRLRFEDDFGTMYWSVSWGNYTGPNTGSFTNDADGNFGPPTTNALPSTTLQALRFPGSFAAMHTTDLADYALTPGAATFRNNGNATFTVSPPPPPCRPDWNGDDVLNSQDFFDFLTSFFDGVGDYNDDTVNNSQDFFDFLTDFFAGC